MFRLLSAFVLLTLTLSYQTAHACSCYCEYGHKVSDFLEQHTVFWGLPTSSHFERETNTVVTKIEVLEGYGRIKAKSVKVTSMPDDGATCGITIPLAVPELLTAYKNSNDRLGVNSCVCDIPAKPLFEYLEAGKDAYIPKIDKCFDKDMNPKKSSYCKVWNSSSEDKQLIWKKKLDFIVKLRDETQAAND